MDREENATDEDLAVSDSDKENENLEKIKSFPLKGSRFPEISTKIWKKSTKIWRKSSKIWKKVSQRVPKISKLCLSKGRFLIFGLDIPVTSPT